MRIGSAVLEIHIIGAQSLKQKRMILLSVIKRAQNKFNAAIAEVGSQDLWQRAEVGIAVVSTSTKHADGQLQVIVNFFEQDPRLEVITVETEVI